MTTKTRRHASLLALLPLLLLVAGSPAAAGGASPQAALGEVAAKIVGGGPASQGQNRWIASLQRGGHFCGASLVADRWVVTAGHCVVGEKAGKLRVWIGGYDLRRPQDGATAKVKKIHLHPNYDDATLRHDIALLELQSAVPASIQRAVPATAAVDAELAAPQQTVTVSGWGSLSENGRSPNVLHEVQLPVVANGECSAVYGGDVFSTNLCAGLRQGGKDSCQGDSGGPLWATRGGQDHLLGIVSWGEGCAAPRRYGVYTRVASYAGWIAAKTGGGSAPQPEPGPGPGPGAGASCSNRCGGQADDGCWCDAECALLGDCCSDYEQVCAAAQDECTQTVCAIDPYCCEVEWDRQCKKLARRVC